MGDISCTIEVNLHDKIPFFQRHLLEGFISENTGIVYQDVNSAIGIERIIDNTLGAGFV